MPKDFHEITPTGPVSATLTPPPSKSYTLRACILGALGDGTTTIRNALVAGDSKVIVGGISALKINAAFDSTNKTITIKGRGGSITADKAILDVGAAGAAMRFMLPLSTLGNGTFQIKGNKRLSERPLAELLGALKTLGVKIESDNNHLPVTVHANGVRGGRVKLDGLRSSQFASGLLMVAPCFTDGLELELAGTQVSRPYIDMTLCAMEAFGISAERDGDTIRVGPGTYNATEYVVEPDASAASYLFAASAIAGGSVTVPGVPESSAQGDWVFVDILEQMGCRVDRGGTGVTVHAKRLIGIDVDMRDTPDIVPTLAAVAACAKGWTRMTGIAHLRGKESDRIGVLARELAMLGVPVEAGPDSFAVKGAIPHGGTVNPEGDHRMAMAISLLGLRTPGIRISDPEVVNKSFPGFFNVIDAAAQAAAPKV